MSGLNIKLICVGEINLQNGYFDTITYKPGDIVDANIDDSGVSFVYKVIEGMKYYSHRFSIDSISKSFIVFNQL